MEPDGYSNKFQWIPSDSNGSQWISPFKQNLSPPTSFMDLFTFFSMSLVMDAWGKLYKNTEETFVYRIFENLGWLLEVRHHQLQQAPVVSRPLLENLLCSSLSLPSSPRRRVVALCLLLLLFTRDHMYRSFCIFRMCLRFIFDIVMWDIRDLSMLAVEALPEHSYFFAAPFLFEDIGCSVHLQWSNYPCPETTLYSEIFSFWIFL